MLVRASLSVPILLLCSAALAEPILTVLPTDGVFDAPFDVALQGAPAKAEVVIRTSRSTEEGKAGRRSAFIKLTAKERLTLLECHRFEEVTVESVRTVFCVRLCLQTLPASMTIPKC